MILIKNGLIRPVTSPDIPGGDILVDGGKIAAIGVNLEAPEGAQIIDATGLLVTPGFVDGHCHIGMHEEASRWKATTPTNPLIPSPRRCAPSTPSTRWTRPLTRRCAAA